MSDMQTNLLQILQVPSLVYVASAPRLTYEGLLAAIKKLEADVRLRFSLYEGNLYFLGDPERVIEALTEAGSRLGSPKSTEITVDDLISNPRPYKPIIYQVLDAYFHFKGFEKALFVKRTGEYGVKRSSIYIAAQDIADQKVIKPWGKYHPEGRPIIMGYDDFLRRNDEPGKERRTLSKSDFFVHEGFNYHIETIDENVYLAIVPRTFITKNRCDLLVGKEHSGLYTRVNYARYNWEIRALLNYWVSYLADASLNRYGREATPLNEPSQNILIPAVGGNPLIVSTSFETAEEGLGVV